MLCKCAKCKKEAEIICFVDDRPWCEECLDRALGTPPKKERVVFRKDKDLYTNTEKILAVFPDDDSRIGTVAYVSFYFDGYGRAVFEPYGEMALSYYYNKTSPVKKDSHEIGLFKYALKEQFGKDFDVRESFPRA